MDRVPPPKPQAKPVPVLSADQLKALLRSARGQGFEDVRDNALIRLLLDTGIRRPEAANLQGRMTMTGDIEGDIDLDTNTAVVIGNARRSSWRSRRA